MRITLHHAPEQLCVEVANGRPVGAPAAGGPGMGLLGMRERVALFGGSLDAGPDAGGFRVLAVLPVLP